MGWDVGTKLDFPSKKGKKITRVSFKRSQIIS